MLVGMSCYPDFMWILEKKLEKRNSWIGYCGGLLLLVVWFLRTNEHFTRFGVGDDKIFDSRIDL